MSGYDIYEINLVIPLDEIYGGTGTNNYLKGDMLYSSSTNTLSKIGIGATGQVLTSNGSIPTWSSTKGLTGATGATGTTGATGQSNMLYSTYLALSTDQLVNDGADIIYDSPAEYISSIYTYLVTPPNTANVTVNRRGTYMVMISIYTSVQTQHIFGISVNNNIPIPQYKIEWNDNDGLTTYTTIINLNVGDYFSIRNISGIATQLVSSNGSSINPAIVADLNVALINEF